VAVPGKRYPWVWDYDIDEQQFDEILAGRLKIGRKDRDWAAVRLIEYSTYPEMIRHIGLLTLVQNWSRWRSRIRAREQQRALDFVVEYVSSRHLEWLQTNERR
jgi:hypothetical protein